MDNHEARIALHDMGIMVDLGDHRPAIEILEALRTMRLPQMAVIETVELPPQATLRLRPRRSDNDCKDTPYFGG